MARILIIDDDDLMLEMVRDMLMRAGYEVLVAQDGNEGLERFRKNRVDLVITDLFMPEKDGVEVILELQREFPGTKIIVISGGSVRGRLDLLSVVQDLGVRYAFVKPFHRRAILDAVKEVLDE